VSQNRRFRLIVPFPPGGSTAYTADALVRLMDAAQGPRLTVDYRLGEFGIPALQELGSDREGSVLMLGTVTTHAITPVLYADRLATGTEQAARPVSRVATFPAVVITHRDCAEDTLRGFLGRLQAGDGTLTFGTDFLGSHVDADAIALGEVAALKVKYRAANGANRILADLIDHRIDLAFLNVATAAANVGRYRPLAVTAPRRLPNFPGVPTMAEAGYPGIGTANWQGLFASSAVADDTVAHLYEATVAALRSPAAREAFARVDADITPSASRDAFAAEVRAEQQGWRALMPKILALQEAS
jgi:tripartite-type tricarboxylate transporter receptor subunit TctC